MKKINFNTPAPLTEDDATLAAIDRGIRDADEGRTVPVEEVRKMIPERISKFESRKITIADFEEILDYSLTNFPGTAERLAEPP